MMGICEIYFFVVLHVLLADGEINILYYSDIVISHPEEILYSILAGADKCLRQRFL